MKDFNYDGKTYRKVALKNLKTGEYFTIRPTALDEEPKENKVWVKGEYDRSMHCYSIYKFCDICYERFMMGRQEVYTGFTF